MRTVAVGLLCIVILVALCGCYRTRYVNLVDPERVSAVDQPERKKVSRWQHFYLYGWAPGEMLIDAAGACGGAEHVHSIETQRSFVQGLIAALASYYINVYSPYTGWVICDDSVPVPKKKKRTPWRRRRKP